MTYLISQIFLSLVVAFLLGLLLGYLLCKFFACKGSRQENAKAVKASGVVNADEVSVDDIADELTDDLPDDAEEMVSIDLDTNVDLESDEYLIETLEGIGPQTGNLFREYGVHTVGDFLRKLHKPSSRKQAADDLNILVKPLHDWASMADLLRVEGIDHQWAELTYATGVETVGQLANSNADDLADEMETVNNAGKQHIAPTLPTAEQVGEWIAKAKKMSPVITV